VQNPYKDFSTVSPQRENGHREIENSVYHALMHAGLSGAEYQIVLCVIDKTWGYNKREDMIPIAQFETSTGLDRRYIARLLHDLEEKHIIIVQRISQGGRGHGNIYMLNKYWDTWAIPSQTLTTRQPLETAPPGQPLASKGDEESTFKETLTTRQPLASKGDWESTFGNTDALSTFMGERLTKSTIKVDGHAQLKVDSQSPSKERSKERSKEIHHDVKERDSSTTDTLAPVTPASKYLFENTKRKRWPNLVQKGQFEQVEADVGFDHMKDAIDWALTSGISNIKSILTAAKRKRKGGQNGAGAEGQPSSHQSDTSEGSQPGQWRAIKSTDA
jgi:phage replication O-like protein O